MCKKETLLSLTWCTKIPKTEIKLYRRRKAQQTQNYQNFKMKIKMKRFRILIKSISMLLE